jgi:hypothetical protein
MTSQMEPLRCRSLYSKWERSTHRDFAGYEDPGVEAHRVCRSRAGVQLVVSTAACRPRHASSAVSATDIGLVLKDADVGAITED